VFAGDILGTGGWGAAFSATTALSAFGFVENPPFLRVFATNYSHQI
jgi:hypothetical protein